MNWRCWCLLGAALTAHAQPVTVVLVRHAERAAAPAQDPPLTEAGHARARLLAGMLRDASIAAVYASEFRRTIQTAKPTADHFRLPVTSVKGADPQELRKRILSHKGRTVLIAGHSNTIPALIAALGGPGDITIAESEFDRLFVMHIGPATGAALLPLRYGTAAPQAKAGAGLPKRMQFRRSGGIAAIPVRGALEIDAGGARVTGDRGYSRAIPAEAASRLFEAVAAWPAESPPMRGADRYQYDITIDGGRSITFGESAAGELPGWIRKEIAAIEHAARAGSRVSR